MTEVLRLPDTEAAVVTFLNAALTPPVSTRTPNPRPAAYVRVSSAGGRSTNPATADPQVLVESYAGSSVTASTNALDAWHALSAARGSFIAPGVWLVTADCGVPVNFPDPDTTDARYQFVASLALSKTEA